MSPTPVEIRQRGRQLVGSFPYGAVATIADRGSVRKERFASRAFDFSVDSPDHEVNLLRGHSFDNPLASQQAGTLQLTSTAAALEFLAVLPEESEQTTWMRDTVLAVRSGLLRGISPGFRVPPASAVPDAEELVPEPGNPGVMIRQINAAVLFELSLVTRPTYQDTTVENRAAELDAARRPRVWL